ncbi:hypothetical protein NMY22_g13332 [Coprinellus aureogranulatus]|nr:hypothetical protein NMY22_g13332 [Coprinellus aureogranulatus]
MLGATSKVPPTVAGILDHTGPVGLDVDPVTASLSLQPPPTKTRTPTHSKSLKSSLILRWKDAGMVRAQVARVLVELRHGYDSFIVFSTSLHRTHTISNSRQGATPVSRRRWQQRPLPPPQLEPMQGLVHSARSTGMTSCSDARCRAGSLSLLSLLHIPIIHLPTFSFNEYHLIEPEPNQSRAEQARTNELNAHRTRSSGLPPLLHRRFDDLKNLLIRPPTRYFSHNDLAELRSPGKSGLVTVLIGLKWWAPLRDSDPRWLEAVKDMKSCFIHINRK